MTLKYTLELFLGDSVSIKAAPIAVQIQHKIINFRAQTARIGPGGAAGADRVAPKVSIRVGRGGPHSAQWCNGAYYTLKIKMHRLKMHRGALVHLIISSNEKHVHRGATVHWHSF